jgi:hypothetical protein
MRVGVALVAAALAGGTAVACSGGIDADSADKRISLAEERAGEERTRGPCPCPRDRNQIIARQPLRCYCGPDEPGGPCPLSAEALAAEWSSCLIEGLRIWRDSGCGMVRLTRSGGAGGDTFTFDEATGQLLGVTLAGDVSFGQCTTHFYLYGDDVACPAADTQTCLLCGDPGTTSTIPRCRP